MAGRRARRRDATRAPRRKLAGGPRGKPEAPPPARDSGRAVAVWAVLAVIVLVAALIRFRLLDVPLERDEGEYGYAGQLILQGVAPFAQMYNMKLPGIYLVYAAILAVFGQTEAGIHLGLLLANAAGILLVFLLARRFTGDRPALVSAAAFAVLSLGRPVQGSTANAEQFLLVPALGGLLLVLRALEGNRLRLLFLGALLLGTGFAIKQHGVAFAAGAGLYVLLDRLRARPRDLPRVAAWCGVFAAGAALPYLGTALWMLLAGVWKEFWFWTVDYARTYTDQVPLAAAWVLLKMNAGALARADWPILALAAVGAFTLWRERSRRPRPGFLLLLAASSGIAVSFGLYFRPHYFVLLLPATAIFAGLGVAFLRDRIAGRRRGLAWVPVAAGLVAAAYPIAGDAGFLFRMDPTEASRAMYGLNPFPECVEIARHIAADTRPEDRIAVLGSEPEIYFYARRRSATSFYYTYAMGETHGYALRLQEQMIAQIEQARPRYLVLVQMPISWLKRPGSPNRLLEWFAGYRDSHYELTGLVEFAGEKSRARWGPGIPWPPRSEYRIEVLRRKD